MTWVCQSPQRKRGGGNPSLTAAGSDEVNISRGALLECRRFPAAHIMELVGGRGDIGEPEPVRTDSSEKLVNGGVPDDSLGVEKLGTIQTAGGVGEQVLGPF